MTTVVFLLAFGAVAFAAAGISLAVALAAALIDAWTER